MSANLSDLKSVLDQVVGSVDFQDKEVMYVYHQESTTERLIISNSTPPNHADPEVQVDMNNATLILKEGVEL